MQRTLFSDEHDAMREAVRAWVDSEVRPHQEQWRRDGIVDREIWRSAGALGLLCTWMEERWGGPGGDFLHAVVVIEELARAYESGFAAALHSDIVVPYVHAFATNAVKEVWLPRCASGDAVGALAMTEPDTGSDVAAIRTRAVRDGDDWVIDGSKTFISNGLSCDFAVVAARTGGPDADPHAALSLFFVEADRPGFVRGKKLEKMGMASQDTAELHFEGCRVPASHLLGQEGGGFLMLMNKLQQERLVVAVGAQASAEQVLADTMVWVQERKAFGKPIARFQNTQFKLVECATEIEVGRAFLDRLIVEHTQGAYLVKECSMAKYWQTEMLQRVCDTCLQLFGGYGYMLEYPISRAFMDARVQRIYAGTNEIMKVIVARQLGL
ncbi:MAG: acyl-CoA dehydrogenase family protein [Alphaproteobacteria bacterium]|nr:acyl-CoA dehydrogenase family protein [Alphaproteobacteria bacterium]